LSLISGRNPDYLIDKHVEAASLLKNSNLEIIPTGYILIENGKETSVQRVTQTKPMKRNDITKIVDTAFAGQLLGHKLLYLEAGSRSKEELQNAYLAGADMVVIGTAFEEDESFFEELKK